MALATREASATVTDALKADVLDRVAESRAYDLVSRAGGGRLRILFLVSAHNGLSQRAWIAFTELGHDVAVTVVGSAAAMEAAVREHDPQLIVCPFLKQMIPESIWSTRRCLIVHPGPPGDRGPSSLDWAIELDEPVWGVTVLQANGEPDAGKVWATRRLPDAARRARAACTGMRSGTPRSKHSSRRLKGSPIATASPRRSAIHSDGR